MDFLGTSTTTGASGNPVTAGPLEILRGLRCERGPEL